MSIGMFWTYVTYLCLLYDGKVTSGPRSRSWNEEISGHNLSAHRLGLAADIQFRTESNRDEAADQATKMALFASKKVLAIHVEPKDY